MTIMITIIIQSSFFFQFFWLVSSCVYKLYPDSVKMFDIIFIVN